MALEPLTDVIHNEKKHSELLINGHEEIFTDNHSECCQSDDDANENNVVEINSLCSEKEYQHVAIACDDGCMRLYRISDSDRFSYRRSFPRVSGKLINNVPCLLITFCSCHALKYFQCTWQDVL